MPTETWAIIVMAVASVFAASGTFFVKLSTPKLSFNIRKIIKNWKLLLGIFLYGFATFISLFALKAGELSVLYPVVALQYIWTNFLSMKYLDEKITLAKWAGIALILIGVCLVGIKA